MKGKYFTMKTKMVFSEYNPETRMSTVKVANTLGIFTGYAKCHPQDTESSFLGCHLAEYRATIKALKYEANLLNSQINVLYQTYGMFEANKDFNPNSLEARKIRKMTYIKENKYNEIINQITSLEQRAEELPLNREKVLKKINNMTAQNSDKDN